MPIYLVDLSINDTSHDYSDLWEQLRIVDAKPCFDFIWLLETKQNLQALTMTLSRCCAQGDGLLIVELNSKTRWSGTGLNDEVRTWIAERTVRGKLVVKPP